MTVCCVGLFRGHALDWFGNFEAKQEVTVFLVDSRIIRGHVDRRNTTTSARMTLFASLLCEKQQLEPLPPSDPGVSSAMC
jgi:hypothetical protein